jgi:hypothetical protein
MLLPVPVSCSQRWGWRVYYDAQLGGSLGENQIDAILLLIAARTVHPDNLDQPIEYRGSMPFSGKLQILTYPLAIRRVATD